MGCNCGGSTPRVTREGAPGASAREPRPPSRDRPADAAPLGAAPAIRTAATTPPRRRSQSSTSGTAPRVPSASASCADFPDRRSPGRSTSSACRTPSARPEPGQGRAGADRARHARLADRIRREDHQRPGHLPAAADHAVADPRLRLLRHGRRVQVCRRVLRPLDQPAWAVRRRGTTRTATSSRPTTSR